ncbi:MAG: HNH endonuclease [Clostridia bacterium]|nr:HNH endonuclease [Clostridia bacterium]MBQ8636090.1 HNH endonuclease [bacterium]
MKNTLKILDALEINFVDSCCREEFKLDTSGERKPGKNKGSGEKRLFIKGVKDPSFYDEFFEFDKVKYFFFKKSDLLNYMKEIKEEYLNPSQDYQENISHYYGENLNYINSLKKEYTKLEFHRTHDKQNRYYLVLNGNKTGKNPNRVAYSFILNICLPRITKINFVKLINENTGELFIYLKPTYFEKNNKIDQLTLTDVTPKKSKSKEKTRKAQSKYRFELLQKMPACVITGVADDRLLIACHIKPYSICDEEEEFDANNGIIMTPTFHYMFDIGFISFKDNGELMISDFLSNLNKKRLDIYNGKPCAINTKSKKYLEYHRKNIFSRVQIDESELID